MFLEVLQVLEVLQASHTPPNPHSAAKRAEAGWLACCAGFAFCSGDAAAAPAPAALLFSFLETSKLWGRRRFSFHFHEFKNARLVLSIHFSLVEMDVST